MLLSIIPRVTPVSDQSRQISLVTFLLTLAALQAPVSAKTLPDTANSLASRIDRISAALDAKASASEEVELDTATMLYLARVVWRNGDGGVVWRNSGSGWRNSSRGWRNGGSVWRDGWRDRGGFNNWRNF